MQALTTYSIKDYNLETGTLVQTEKNLNLFALISTHWALFEVANATSDFQLIQLCNDIFDKDSLCGWKSGFWLLEGSLSESTVFSKRFPEFEKVMYIVGQIRYLF